MKFILCAVVLVWGAVSVAATPCEDASPELNALRDRLDRAHGARGWTALAKEAEAAVVTLGARGTLKAHVCAHYLAGGARFFLSSGAAGRDEATAALGHLLTAEGLSPSLMRGRQARSRLKTLWRRAVGAGDLVAVTAQPLRDGTLAIGRGALSWRVPMGRGRVLSLKLMPGIYTLRHVDSCGESSVEVEVVGGPLALPPPPACRITIEGLDEGQPVSALVFEGPSGPLRAEALHGGLGSVTVGAAGYLPVVTELPARGGEVSVALRRCPVALTVKARPASAAVAGAGTAPWGARTVSAEAVGYLPFERKVEVPRPKNCVGAAHTVTLALLRAVRVEAHDEGGAPVSLSTLVVQGRTVSVEGFGQAPGTYAWRARHPVLGTAMGRAQIHPCPVEGACPEAVLEITLRSARPFVPQKASIGPTILMVAGGVLAVGGMGQGLSALDTQNRIDGYTTKAEEDEALDDLIDGRDEQARNADMLLLTGAVLVSAGLVWRWLEAQ